MIFMATRWPVTECVATEAIANDSQSAFPYRVAPRFRICQLTFDLSKTPRPQRLL